MTAVLEAPVSLCPDCVRPGRNRWGSPLPKRSPDNLSFEHIEATFRLHPWLETSRLGALARALRDSVASNV